MKKLYSIIAFLTAPAITALIITPITYFHFSWTTRTGFSDSSLADFFPTWAIVIAIFSYIGMGMFGLPSILYLKSRNRYRLLDYLTYGIISGFSATLLFSLLFWPLAPIIFLASILCSCLYWIIENTLIKKAD